MFNKISLTDIDVSGKKVFLRVDFNVPLNKEGKVQDDFRIRAALETIDYLIKKNASLIVASHLGRPGGEVKPELRLEPVAERLAEIIEKEVKMAPDCIGKDVKKMVDDLGEGEILLLENLRFHKGEKENDPGFARELASLADIYVNDAFGAAHRAHASTVGITEYFDVCAAGFLMNKEIDYLGKAIQKPEKPLVVILGGAKVSTKIDVIKNLLDKCDSILLGGAMVYTFLKAKNMDTGDSLVEEDKINVAGEIIKQAEDSGVKLLMPVDHVVTKEIDQETEMTTISDEEGIPEGWKGVDIGPKTIEKYVAVVERAKTVVWNGPMGIFEMPTFSDGTFKIAESIAEGSALSIIGGGDTASAVKAANVFEKMSHVSTGGGASLDFLAGKNLPGIDALTDK